MLMRWLLVIVFLMHGFGHIMGFLAAFTTTPMGFADRPWILPGDFMVTSPVGKAWGLLWLVALLGFMGAALGLIYREEWWLAMAAAAAAISLVAILPWWNTVTTGARIGVFVDLVILAAAVFWSDGLQALVARGG